MRHFCTYFDRNYLVKGLTMIESLRRSQRAPFRIFVVCIDELTRTLLMHLAIPEVVTIPLHELEHRDAALARARSNRSFVGYLWTLTPVSILKILDAHPEVDTIFYVDADLFFTSSIEPMLEELGEGDVIIHEHRFPPAWKYLEAHGKYNVGLVGFRNTARGREVATYWRDCCLEWCDTGVHDGKMGDQAYLNDWPERFPGVVVTQNIGVGVAPWNHDQYGFSLREGVVCANDTPVVFYHFHSFTFVTRELVMPVLHDPYTLPHSVNEFFVLPYLAALDESMRRIEELLPSFHFGLEEGTGKFSSHRPFLVTEGLKAKLIEQGFDLDYVPLAPPWWCVGEREG